jgi:thiamine pyrophosphokinase
MKRYRVLGVDFDSRATILKKKIQDNWKPQVKDSWKQNKEAIKEHLVAQHGAFGYHAKLKNFIDLGPAPWSVIAFHNKFQRQVRDSFVVGSYYPSLTGACALGERILNQLLLHLRGYYKSTPEYKKICRKDSFDNWDLVMDTLESWGVLLPDATDAFRKLKDTRHKSIHFNPETDTNDRELALTAIEQLSKVIQEQFAAFGTQPWFIPSTRGAAFVRKSQEEIPFVREVILPNCVLVGPLHTLEQKNRQWVVHDNHEYALHEVSDAEFAEMFNNRKI